MIYKVSLYIHDNKVHTISASTFYHTAHLDEHGKNKVASRIPLDNRRQHATMASRIRNCSRLPPYYLPCHSILTNLTGADPE